MRHSILARSRALLIPAAAALTLLGGCASTGNPRDPLEPVNRVVYTFNDGLDTVLIKPAAEVYRGLLPDAVRTGISNFFSNLRDVTVAVNNLLQGKFSEAGSDVSRIAINTTVGILGLFDPASEMGFEKHDEDFGQTLGRWGFGDGPYLVLPLFGPSSLRDGIALIADYYTDPNSYVKPPRTQNQIWGLRMVNKRAELLGASRILQVAALDPYEFLRDAYLQRRRNLVYDGNPPREDFDLKDEPSSRAPGAGLTTDFAQLPVFTGIALTTRAAESGANVPQPDAETMPPAASVTRPAPAPAPRVVRIWTTQRSTDR